MCETLGRCFGIDPMFIYENWHLSRLIKSFELYREDQYNELIINGLLHDKDLRNDKEKAKSKMDSRPSEPDKLALQIMGKG